MSLCPTSQSWMSKICRDLESLRKMLERSVSDLKFFTQKWSTIAAAKKVLMDFFLHWFTFEVSFQRLFAPTS